VKWRYAAITLEVRAFARLLRGVVLSIHDFGCFALSALLLVPLQADGSLRLCDSTADCAVSMVRIFVFTLPRFISAFYSRAVVDRWCVDESHRWQVVLCCRCSAIGTTRRTILSRLLTTSATQHHDIPKTGSSGSRALTIQSQTDTGKPLRAEVLSSPFQLALSKQSHVIDVCFVALSGARPMAAGADESVCRRRRR
jgi:hypothetical protein